MFKPSTKYGIQSNQVLFVGRPASRRTSSKLPSMKSSVQEESMEIPEGRTFSFDYESHFKLMSRTSSDLQMSLRQQFLPTQIQMAIPVPLIEQKSCVFFQAGSQQPTSSRQSKPSEITLQSIQSVPVKSFASIPEENNQIKGTNFFRRKKSLIILESDANETDQLKTMKNIKNAGEPDEFFDMTTFQQKIWQRLVGLPQDQITQACQLNVLVNAPHDEYEMTIDVSNIPFNWNMAELAVLINDVFMKQKDINVINNPHLCILVGRIKTQRLDNSLKIFELINMVVNGINLIVLEDK